MQKFLSAKVGLITLDGEALATADRQQLVVLTPPPGSSALENLRLLAVIGDHSVDSR